MNKKTRNKLWAWIIIGGLTFSVHACASIGTFTPKGAQIANSAVTVAQGLLHSLDTFYDDLVSLKAVPDYTTEATRALSIADSAAAVLRAAIAKATVTDEQLNVAAGQVSGAQAMLEQMK